MGKGEREKKGAEDGIKRETTRYYTGHSERGEEKGGNEEERAREIPGPLSKE